MSRFFCLGSIAIILLTSASSFGQQTEVDIATEIDEMAIEFRQQYKVPGLTVAIARDGKIFFSKAFGKSDLENDVNAKPETVFRTASIAKPLTAVAVLQLVEQGKIKLDDPIQKHCPEFPKTEKPLTIRHLLCHLGGVRHYKARGESAGTKAFYTIKDSLDLFKDDKLKYEPGSKFSYTTYGYSLLGRAIETASGMSYREYLQKNVFDPAGMNASGLDDWFRIIPNRTRGYARLSRTMHQSLPSEVQKMTKPGEVYNCQLHDTSMKIPGGGLVSTSPDLVRFGMAMLENKLIKEETCEQAWTTQKTNEGKATRYGLGWNIATDGAKIISHSGGQAGTSTFLIIVPKHKLCVAVMSNLQGAPCTVLAKKMATAIVTDAKK